MVPFLEPHTREDYVETVIFSCDLDLVEGEKQEVLQGRSSCDHFLFEKGRFLVASWILVLP